MAERRTAKDADLVVVPIAAVFAARRVAQGAVLHPVGARAVRVDLGPVAARVGVVGMTVRLVLTAEDRASRFAQAHRATVAGIIARGVLTEPKVFRVRNGRDRVVRPVSRVGVQRLVRGSRDLGVGASARVVGVGGSERLAVMRGEGVVRVAVAALLMVCHGARKWFWRKRSERKRWGRETTTKRRRVSALATKQHWVADFDAPSIGMRLLLLKGIVRH